MLISPVEVLGIVLLVAVVVAVLIFRRVRKAVTIH